MKDLPIQNLDIVDIEGARKDGGVDLLIVASRRLDGSTEIQKLLLAKVQTYVEYIKTPGFKEEFADPRPDQIRIILVCVEKPDPIVYALIERIKPWVVQNNARFELRIDKDCSRSNRQID